MIEQIKGLEIEGRKFLPKKTLNFFDPTPKGAKPQRLSLVLGRNGTGKSTIASAFRHVNPASVDGRLKVSAIKDDGSLISLPNEALLNKKAFRVFDERYVDTKIKLLPDKTGLGSIILVGDAGDIEGLINKKESEIKAATQVEEGLDKEIKDLEDHNKPQSPSYLLETVKELLRVGWSEEDRQLKNGSTRSKVTDQLVKEIGELVCETEEDKIESAQEDIKHALDGLSAVGDISAIPYLAEFGLGDFDEDAFVNLLNQKVEVPELTDREKKILALMGDKEGRVGEICKTFSMETDYCPYCFRPITKDERQDLVESITKVLNPGEHEYKAKLQGVKLPSFSFAKATYLKIDEDEANKLEAEVNSLNSVVKEYAADLQSKSLNIYQTTDFSNRGLKEAIISANERVGRLEATRKKLVDANQQKTDLRAKQVLLCKEKAHYVIASKYKQYIEQEELLENKRNDKANATSKREGLEKELDDLKSQKKGIGLAVDCINKSLSCIYSSDSRFAIEAKDDQYILKSNGHDIKPCDVSTGERHALALAYFFVDIMANHEIKKFFTDETLLVIDDPVSSFDNENKVGVFSFLMRMFNDILAGNEKSRIILMTHDMHTMVQMSKAGDTVIKELLKAPKGSIRFLKIDYDGEIAVFNPEGYNEYSSLLMDVFQFAKNGDSALCAHAVGNEIRRILEGYSTFLYRKDFLALFYDSMTKSKLGEFAGYYETRMARTVLHGESHMMFQAQAFSSSGNFFAETEDDERQQIAKDVLVLLYILDPEHLKSHFEQMRKDQRYAKLTPIAEIESWKQSIKQSIQAKATV